MQARLAGRSFDRLDLWEIKRRPVRGECVRAAHPKQQTQVVRRSKALRQLHAHQRPVLAPSAEKLLGLDVDLAHLPWLLLDREAKMELMNPTSPGRESAIRQYRLLVSQHLPAQTLLTVDLYTLGP